MENLFFIKYLSRLFLVVLFVTISINCSEIGKKNGGSSSYKAAVVGLNVKKMVVQPKYILLIATDFYRSYIDYLMRSDKIDIVIMPEGGLLGPNEPYPIKVPSTEDYVIPCNQKGVYEAPLVELSCTASEKNIYLVVNLIESHFNSSSNRTMKFNTNVVFDRKGAVIARYRKSNTPGIGYDTPGKPDVSYFDTDFNVTFGLITGNDLLFKEPIHTLLHKQKIKHFIHPTKWCNELPFLTGIQMQSAWAYSTDTILLSAGYTDPELGYSGTGIYDGLKGPIEFSQSESKKPFAIVRDVPKLKYQQKIFVRDVPGIAPTPDKNKNRTLLNLEFLLKEPTTLLEENIEIMEERIRNRHKAPLNFLSGSNSVIPKHRLKLKQDDANKYKTRLIEPQLDYVFKTVTPSNFEITGTAYVNETICYNSKGQKKPNFCCNFMLKMTTVYLSNISTSNYSISGDNFPNYYYRLAVYEGAKDFINNDGSFFPSDIQICGVIPCLNKTANSCGLRTDRFDTDVPSIVAPASVEVSGLTYLQTYTIFEYINIQTELHDHNSRSYPLILQKSFVDKEYGSVPNTNLFTFNVAKVNDKNCILSLKTTQQIKDLGSISIFTKLYSSSSSSIKTNIEHLLFIFSLICIYFA